MKQKNEKGDVCDMTEAKTKPKIVITNEKFRALQEVFFRVTVVEGVLDNKDDFEEKLALYKTALEDVAKILKITWITDE